MDEPGGHSRTLTRGTWVRWTAAVIVVAAIALGVWWRDTATRQTVRIDSAIDSRLHSRIAETLAQGQKDWQSDAGVVLVSLTLERNAVSAGYPPLIILKSSAAAEQYYAELDGALAHITKSGTEAATKGTDQEELLQIYPDEWRVALQQIMDAAEAAGGKAFRRQWPNARIVLELTKTNLGGSEWSISYLTPNAAVSDMWTAYVNAQTGQVRQTVPGE